MTLGGPSQDMSPFRETAVSRPTLLLYMVELYGGIV